MHGADSIVVKTGSELDEEEALAEECHGPVDTCDWLAAIPCALIEESKFVLVASHLTHHFGAHIE